MRPPVFGNNLAQRGWKEMGWLKVKIVADKEACVGAAACVGVAPEVFQLDEAFKVEIIDPEGADEDMILQAAEACPVQAIALFDDDGKQVFP